MSEHDSPEVQAAIEREKRLWTIEQNIVAVEHEVDTRAESIDGKLDRLIEEVTALKNHVATQNGRVTKNEAALVNLGVRIEDIETYVIKPLKAVVDSIGAQVEKLWSTQATLNGHAQGKAAVLRLQWKVAETLGRIVGSSVVIGGAILLLNLVGIQIGGK